MHLALLNTRKAPHFDTVHYTDWAYQMKMHLILLHPRLWKIVYIGVVTFRVFVQQKIRTFKKILQCVDHVVARSNLSPTR